MAKKLGPVRFAYAVLAVQHAVDPGIEHPPAPIAQIGDILTLPTQDGAIQIIEQENGPATDILHLHYVGSGRELENGDIDFPYETKRLLALIQIGAQNERAVHGLVDDIFEQVERLLEDGAKPEHLEPLRARFP